MSFKIKHIAFADDDPDDHYLFSETVGESFEGIRISPYFDCDKLLNELHDDKEELPDMIFLDLNMPGNDGNRCLDQIKQSAELKHIPVVIYSTSNHPRYIEESYNKGAFKYIIKPTSIIDLSETIKALFSDFEELTIKADQD